MAYDCPYAILALELGGAFASEAWASYLAKALSTVNFKASRRCTACELPSAAPAAGGYSVPRRHSTAPRSDRPRTELRREGLWHPFAKTVKPNRRGHKAPRALTGAKRAPRQVTSGEASYPATSAAHEPNCKGKIGIGIERGPPFGWRLSGAAARR